MVQMNLTKLCVDCRWLKSEYAGQDPRYKRCSHPVVMARHSDGDVFVDGKPSMPFASHERKNDQGCGAEARLYEQKETKGVSEQSSGGLSSRFQWAEFCLGAALSLFLVFIATAICRAHPEDIRTDMRREATRAGAARWDVNAETGNPEFHWIDSRVEDGK